MLIEQIGEMVRQNKSVALVTVTGSAGSAPAEPGKEMLVGQTGSIGGTVGGGALEYRAVEDAKECIRTGQSRAFHYDLQKDLGMECGGSADYFVKVYAPAPRLILVGGGHVNHALYQMAVVMGYDVTVIDDRPDIVSPARYPQAKRLVCGDIDEETKKLEIFPEDFVVIATHGHRHDAVALANLAVKKTRYVGMIGSRRKVTETVKKLIEKGVPKAALDSVYAPVGIALGGDEPAEVALSILGEMQLVRRGGALRHMRL